jgi:hypothetical protein
MEEQLKNIVVSATKYLSVGAIFSFITYWHSHRKDRARLKTSAICFTDSIRVKVVNAGRRSIILTALMFEHEDGSTHGRGLGNQTLNENEQCIQDIEFGAGETLYCLESNTGATNIYWVDTQDRKYYVKGAKRNLKQFWKRMDEAAERRKKQLLLVS